MEHAPLPTMPLSAARGLKCSTLPNSKDRKSSNRTHIRVNAFIAVSHTSTCVVSGRRKASANTSSLSTSSNLSGSCVMAKQQIHTAASSSTSSKAAKRSTNELPHEWLAKCVARRGPPRSGYRSANKSAYGTLRASLCGRTNKSTTSHVGAESKSNTCPWRGFGTLPSRSKWRRGSKTPSSAMSARHRASKARKCPTVMPRSSITGSKSAESARPVHVKPEEARKSNSRPALDTTNCDTTPCSQRPFSSGKSPCAHTATLVPRCTRSRQFAPDPPPSPCSNLASTLCALRSSFDAGASTGAGACGGGRDAASGAAGLPSAPEWAPAVFFFWSGAGSGSNSVPGPGAGGAPAPLVSGAGGCMIQDMKAA
mmetsp:Transcript_85407/g.261201  ORF Transcript_85407/g.261201 Transcript_85407/m.261201 type:complete len:368 (-) Transcript_85407:209-1312(-)